jgi:hypothetical protein
MGLISPNLIGKAFNSLRIAGGIMKVFLHTRNRASWNWQNELRNFARIPIVGEYLTLDSESPWYQVLVVVHTPFECDCDAEVYAVMMYNSEIRQQLLREPSV